MGVIRRGNVTVTGVENPNGPLYLPIGRNYTFPCASVIETVIAGPCPVLRAAILFCISCNSGSFIAAIDPAIEVDKIGAVIDGTGRVVVGD